MALAQRLKSSFPLLNTVVRFQSVAYPEFSRNYATATTPPPTKSAPKLKLPIAMYGASGNYASALYLASVKGKVLDEIQSELLDVVQASKNSPIFSRFLNDLSVSKKTRVKALEDICTAAKLSDTTKNFMMLLAENGRLPQMDNIAKKFVELTDAHKGIVRAIVTTAIPLPPKERKDLIETLEGILGQGKTVKLEEKININILGGLVVEFSNKVFDMSLRTRAQQMSKLLREPIDVNIV